MSQGSVRVFRQEQTVTVQVEGWGRMQQSLPLRRYAEQSVAGGVTCLRVDLRRCTYLDSTFLGTLLYLQRFLKRKNNGRLTLVSPSPECGRLLKQIGVDDVFTTENADELAAQAWEELKGGKDDPNAFNQTVVEAHEELAHVGGRCGDTFGKVADGLKKEWHDRK